MAKKEKLTESLKKHIKVRIENVLGDRIRRYDENWNTRYKALLLPAERLLKDITRNPEMEDAYKNSLFTAALWAIDKAIQDRDATVSLQLIDVRSWCNGVVWPEGQVFAKKYQEDIDKMHAQKYEDISKMKQEACQLIQDIMFCDDKAKAEKMLNAYVKKK